MDGPVGRQTAHADAWYTTGSAHVVGQDYALATVGGEAGTSAVVCDGCSGSADTDIGARLIARATLPALARPGPVDPAAVVWRASVAAAALGLPTTALDATLLTARLHATSVEILVSGDGVVAGRHRNGGVHVWVVEHPQGAPRYASYALDEGRARQHAEVFGADGHVCHHAPDGSQQRRVVHDGVHRLSLDRDEYELVLLGSDGLTAFVDASTPVPVGNIVDALLAIPKTRGRFVARRGRRFIHKTCPARGWRPLDDVGIAAIALDPAS